MTFSSPSAPATIEATARRYVSQWTSRASALPHLRAASNILRARCGGVYVLRTVRALFRSNDIGCVELAAFPLRIGSDRRRGARLRGIRAVESSQRLCNVCPCSIATSRARERLLHAAAMMTLKMPGINLRWKYVASPRTLSTSALRFAGMPARRHSATVPRETAKRPATPLSVKPKVAAIGSSASLLARSFTSLSALVSVGVSMRPCGQHAPQTKLPRLACKYAAARRTHARRSYARRR